LVSFPALPNLSLCNSSDCHNMSHHGLIKSFCSYGLPEDSPLHLSSPDLSDGLNTIVSLRMLVFEGNEIVKCSSELISYIQLACVGDKGLWLEVGYGRRGSNIRPGWKPTDPAITWVSFYYLPVEGEMLQVGLEAGYEPVPVIFRAIRSHHKALGVTSGIQRYTGNYDLTGYLGAKAVPTHHLVMVYKTSTTDSPIVDIRLVPTSTVPKADGKVKRVVVLPEGYEQVNFLLGGNHSMLCVKRQKEPWRLSFQAALLQMLPRDSEGEHLAKASAMFCFPAGVHLTPEEQQITTFSYILTSAQEASKGQKENRLYVTCLTFSEEMAPALRSSLRISPALRLFAPKCICLFSPFPYLDNFEQLLKHAFQLSVSSAEYPIERYLSNILEDIPVPDRGKTLIQYQLPDKTLSFQRPSVRAIPEIPPSHLHILFHLLKLESIVQIWSGLMLERKVILHSSLRSVLTPTSLALIGLLFPYKWDHVLIPVLPEQLNAFVETIFPYIIGTGSASALLAAPPDALIVYLDTGNVLCKDPLTPLPAKPLKRLMKRLAVYSDVFHSGVPLADELVPSLVSDHRAEQVKVQAQVVQDCFLELQCELVRDYDHFFHIPSPGADVVQSSLSYINLPDYIKARKLKSDQFSFQLLHTTLFTRFIEARCFCSHSNAEHSYFDSALRYKWTSKAVPFVSFDPPIKIYTCPPVLTEGLPDNYLVQYERFPQLQEELMAGPREQPEFSSSESTDSIPEVSDVRLQGLSDEEWLRALLACIYALWLVVAAAASQLFPKRTDAQETMSLVIAVLRTAKKAKISLDLSVFDRLIEACGHRELKSTANALFKCMRGFGNYLDAYYYGIYIQAAAESHTRFTSSDPTTTAALLPEASEALLLVSDQCQACGKRMSEEDIVTRLEKSGSSSLVTCTCGVNFQAKCNVIPLTPESEEEEVDLLNPLVLAGTLKALGNGEPLMQELTENRCLYWNLAFYFSIVQLPVFILSPLRHSTGIPEAVASYIESTSTFARFADTFTWKGKNADSVDIEDEQSEPVLLRGKSEVVSEKLSFMLERANSRDSPTRKNAVFGRLFSEFQRENMVKRKRLKEISRASTDDIGCEVTSLTPPVLPAMHTKFS